MPKPRRNHERPVRSMATSRSAAMGGTRVARMAGPTAAMAVMTRPTMMAYGGGDRRDHEAGLRQVEAEGVEQDERGRRPGRRRR